MQYFSGSDDDDCVITGASHSKTTPKPTEEEEKRNDERSKARRKKNDDDDDDDDDEPAESSSNKRSRNEECYYDAVLPGEDHSNEVEHGQESSDEGSDGAHEVGAAELGHSPESGDDHEPEAGDGKESRQSWGVARSESESSKDGEGTGEEDDEEEDAEEEEDEMDTDSEIGDPPQESLDPPPSGISFEVALAQGTQKDPYKTWAKTKWEIGTDAGGFKPGNMVYLDIPEVKPEKVIDESFTSILNVGTSFTPSDDGFVFPSDVKKNFQDFLQQIVVLGGEVFEKIFGKLCEDPMNSPLYFYALAKLYKFYGKKGGIMGIFIWVQNSKDLKLYCNDHEFCRCFPTKGRVSERNYLHVAVFKHKGVFKYAFMTLDEAGSDPE
jgi:hypothetical protein